MPCTPKTPFNFILEIDSFEATLPKALPEALPSLPKLCQSSAKGSALSAKGSAKALPCSAPSRACSSTLFAIFVSKLNAFGRALNKI